MTRTPRIALDRDRVGRRSGRSRQSYVRYMLDEAIELLPLAKLYALAQEYLDLKRLRPDTKNATSAICWRT
jgi:hypothetical protein